MMNGIPKLLEPALFTREFEQEAPPPTALAAATRADAARAGCRSPGRARLDSCARALPTTTATAIEGL
jgi:hypothetical protein